MKTAAVFFADGFEEIEALSPVDYLRRAGVNVIMVAVPSPTTEDKYVVTSAHKIPVIMDTTLDEYLSGYGHNLPDCVICPGGSTGADNLAATEILLKHLEDCYNSKKLVAAICASPAVVLGKTNILKNKKWTCYPGMEDNAKKEYLDSYENTVFITDENLVTGRGPGASEQFSMELVKILAGQEIADKIHAGTQQR